MKSGHHGHAHLTTNDTKPIGLLTKTCFIRALMGRPAHFAYARSPIPAREPRVSSLGNYMETLKENCDYGFWVWAKTSATQLLEFYGSDIVIVSPLGLSLASVCD
ncbi:hypothetical protein FIBSPDRAFT_970097 [Athelia psychrophila]|uniref:Uncharacterized protein n=1 Tax=Athelia psychrophila TaxID=1759441 RepID=A0A167SXS5_9AGAM|nr:hypothetical protein FIBSPDRAFT_970097 [Fibularhizoctonia sp. CBS 109695]